MGIVRAPRFLLDLSEHPDIVCRRTNSAAFHMSPPRLPPKIPDYERLCELAKRVPELDPEAVQAVATLRAVGVALGTALEASLARRGVSEGRLRILAMLLDLGKPATHSQLAEMSCVTKGTITGLIDGLEYDGLVRRLPDPDDRRVTFIELSRGGEAYLDRILPGHLKRLSQLMSGLSREEQRQLVTLLGKVSDGLGALDA